MVRFCPACGSNLSDSFSEAGDFKFCPLCGADLKNVVDNQRVENNIVSSGKILICDNCGSENSIGNSVCEVCGIKFSGNEVINETSGNIVKERNIPGTTANNKIIREKRKSVKKPLQSTPQAKMIDVKQVWTIIGVVAGVGLILLYAAGVFDKPSATQNFNQTQTQDSGIDLSNLEQINELEAKYKANSSDSETLLRLAHLKQDSGLYEQAIINYQEYLANVPDNADARIDMGVCYYNLGKFDEAINTMTKALEYNPKHQIAHLNLGIVNLAANNIAKSKEWFQKAVDINPESDIGKRAQELLKSH
jgi:TolA-binding protein